MTFIDIYIYHDALHICILPRWIKLRSLSGPLPMSARQSNASCEPRVLQCITGSQKWSHVTISAGWCENFGVTEVTKINLCKLCQIPSAERNEKRIRKLVRQTWCVNWFWKFWKLQAGRDMSMPNLQRSNVEPHDQSQSDGGFQCFTTRLLKAQQKGHSFHSKTDEDCDTFWGARRICRIIVSLDLSSCLREKCHRETDSKHLTLSTRTPLGREGPHSDQQMGCQLLSKKCWLQLWRHFAS